MGTSGFSTILALRMRFPRGGRGCLERRGGGIGMRIESAERDMGMWSRNVKLLRHDNDLLLMCDV
jgi:hypothetical protein